MEWQTVMTVAGAIVVLANAAAGLYVLIVRPGKKFKQFADKAENFMDDWFGVEERPGVPARPGVMVRLATIEAELHPNHGTSMRDAINRTENAVRRVEDGLAAHLSEHRAAASFTRQLGIPVWPPADEEVIEGDEDGRD